VRALVRNPQKARQLVALGATIVEGDLHTPRALQQLVADSDAVIHGAGAVRGNSQAAFDRVNVAGTAALIAAIESQSNPARLLLLSSLAASEPQLSWYAHSKREGESLVQATELDWVIVRPPAVYGPGDKEMLPIFQCMGRGFAPVPGAVEARTSLVHVSDLVAAITACLLSPGARHQTLTLSDGRDNGYNWQEMAAIAGAVWNRRVRLWRVPAWLLNSAARLNLWLAGITGNAPMLTPPKLRELRHRNWVANNQAITAATGWTPVISLSEGLEEIKKNGTMTG
jgi:nucleoside-diphosphate-sugar epimerase